MGTPTLLIIMTAALPSFAATRSLSQCSAYKRQQIALVTHTPFRTRAARC
jgi:hypothetical protein